MISTRFIERMTQDLSAFSDVMLEAGLAPTTPGEASVAKDSSARLTQKLRELAWLFPRLLEEAVHEDRSARHVLRRTTPVPRRAQASRAPWHHVVVGERLLPTRWLSLEPPQLPRREAVGWLAHLLDELARQLERLDVRLGKHLADALAARSDDSPYARDEKQRLQSMQSRLRACGAVLARLEHLLRTRGGSRIRRRARPPAPALTSPAWARLRLLTPRLVDPQADLPSILSGVLAPHGGATELAYLYQRWVGAQVVLCLEDLGFRAQGDRIGPIFLGEQAIEFRDAADVALTLWCEPRLLQGHDHPSGLKPRRDQEQQPDYVLLVPGSRGEEAYILDPTLSSDPERRQAKYRYRSSLVFRGLTTIAGVPVPKQPRRSWAAAPLTAPHCQLEDNEGRTGTVPMNPLGPQTALRAWIEDIVKGARAWARAEPHERVGAERAASLTGEAESRHRPR